MYANTGITNAAQMMQSRPRTQLTLIISSLLRASTYSALMSTR